MAYRDMVDSLAARLAVLETQVGERTRERDDVARMLAEAQARAKDEAWVEAAPVRARRWRRGFIAVAVAAVLAGIVGALVPARRSSAAAQLDAAIDGMERFANEMCGCSDAQCTQHVSDDMMTWAKQFASDYSPPPTLTPLEQARLELAGTRMGACMQRVMAAGH